MKNRIVYVVGFCSLLFFLPLSLIGYSESKELVSSQEDEFIRQGKEYYAKGDFLRAKAMFELALKENPQNSIAKAYLVKIESALAGATLTDSFPEEIEALYAQGKKAFIEGDYQRAVELFKKVLSQVPNHQYAKMYLKRAQSHISRPNANEISMVEKYAHSYEDSEEISDPSVLKTKLKVALLSLQEQLLGYFQTLSEIKHQQDELLKKYLEEKKRKIKELEDRVRDQSELVDRLSSERLKLQAELDRINQEILLLERRLSSEFYRRTGREVSWRDVEDLDKLESELTQQEKSLRERLKEELELRRQLELELQRIEDKIREQGKQEAQLSNEVKKIREEGLPSRGIVELKKEGEQKVGGALAEEEGQRAKKHEVDRRKLKKLYVEGKRALKRKDYDTAIEKFRKIVELAPADNLSQRARELLEKAEAKRKELWLAQKLLVEETQKKLDLFSQAQSAYFNGEFDRAIDLCEKILRIDPNYGPAKKLKKLVLLAREEKEKEERTKLLKEKKKELASLSEGQKEVRERPQEIQSKQKGEVSQGVKIPDYEAEIKEKLARIKQEAEQRRQESITQRLSEIRDLIQNGNLDKAEELLIRLIRLYPEEETAVKLLSEVRKAKSERIFAESLNEINRLIEKKEYVLAEEKLDSLFRKYPEKRRELFALKKSLNDLLVKPYIEEITSLISKGEIDSLRKALQLSARARRKFPTVSQLRELEKEARLRLERLEDEERRIERARERMLKGLREEISAKSRFFNKDTGIMKKVHTAQEEYLREFYQSILDKAQEYIDIGKYEKAKDILALITDNTPEKYRREADKLIEQIEKEKREREFEKHIEMARSALKIYDFSGAKKEIRKAEMVCPQCKKRLREISSEFEKKLKFYKVRQALKAAQIYLQNSDFVSAKIVVKDVLRNIDPNNRYAKEFLKQIEKAEDLYYADIKLRQGIMALKAGDYESAVRLAREGLRLNASSKDLWDLYRRAKSRWRGEILKRKALLHQIEEEAAEKRRVGMAARKVEHKKLEFRQQVGLLESDVQSLLVQAKRLMEEQRFDRAISLCQKVLEYYPDNVEAQTLLDLILLTQQKVEEKQEGERKERFSKKENEKESKNATTKYADKRCTRSHERGKGKRFAEIDVNSGLNQETQTDNPQDVSSRKTSLILNRSLLSKVDKEVKARYRFLTEGIDWVVRSYRRNITRLARKQLNETIDLLLTRADEYLKKMAIARAEQVVNEAVNLAPEDRRVKKMIQKLERAKNRIILARKELRRKMKKEIERRCQKSSRQDRIEDLYHREIEKLAKKQLKDEISSKLLLAKQALKEKRFKLARLNVKKVLEIVPNNSQALRLLRKIKRLHQQELERIAREKERQEKRYRLARNRMLKGLQRDMDSKVKRLLMGCEELTEKVDRERWLLAKVQKEKEIDERLNKLETLLSKAQKDWDKTDLVREEISRFGEIEELTPVQKRRLSTIKKRFAFLVNKIKQEKIRVGQQVDKKLASLRLAQVQNKSDVPDKKALVRDMLSKAEKALLNGDYRKVLKICEEVLEISPGNKKAISMATRAREMLERESELERKQSTLQEDSYPRLRRWYMDAKKAYDEGDYIRSRELFRRVYEEEKRLGIDYYSPYAKEYLDLIKEREKDIKALDREKETEELKKKIVEKLYEDAKRFEREGRYESAVSVYENILFLFPNDKTAKERLFKVKEKIFAREKEQLQKELDKKDKEMIKEVMKNGLVPTELKRKRVDLQERKTKRLLKLPPVKKKLQQKISAHFEDVPLVDVLRFFAKQTGVNIIPSVSVLKQNYNVTIDITDMPLESALKYLLRSYNLTYQIDEDAVWITTPDQLEKEPMETKVYRLEKGIGLYSKFTTATSGSVELGSGASVSEVKTLKDILEEAVDWPSGSKLVLDERTGSLIVTNTPANIKKIDEILWNLDVTPIQVLIEAKFLEVDVTDLKEIGVHWKIANEDWAVDSVGSQMKHGVAKESGFSYPDFTNASSGLNLTYKGVLTKPQFEAVLHALMQSQNTRTLSSPRVTTLNNQTATIKVVDEWIYPTRYEFQIVQFDINGDGDYDDAGETRYENVPTDFVKRDVGIILKVTPSVGEDLKTITLSLLPEVSDATKNYFQYTGGVSLPKFTSRTLSTNVVVDNTDTVVLGGLIKENRTKVLTKMPFLGDIPLLGNLFRKVSDEIHRRNLLIFVTATIIDPEGDELVAE